MHFLGIPYLGPQRNFLHALEIDQGYLVHTPTETGVPRKISIVNIKNWT